jgi:large subunit ribosomal protein L25
MAEAEVLTAQTRKGIGTQQSKRLRKTGVLPAILYGHKEAVVPLTVPVDDMSRVIRHGSRIVDLKLPDGKVEKCFVREVQWDALGKSLVHVDFTRVSLDERVRVTVPMVIKGNPQQGGVLDQPLHTLDIECLAIKVPDAIRLTTGEMPIGKVIHLKEVPLPEGVKVFGDLERVVVQCIKPVEEVVAPPTEAAAAAGAVEPELIRKPAATEEGEAEAAPAKKEGAAKK